jgi:hypothetical protein
VIGYLLGLCWLLEALEVVGQLLEA